LLFLAACKSETVPSNNSATLYLNRAPDDAFEIRIMNAPSPPRAVQAEVVIDSQQAFTMQDPAHPIGLPLDTVRLEMRGTNRAIMFSGDERGVKIPRDGVVARFHLVPVSGSASADATVRIKSALVVAADGTKIGTQLGAPIPAM
jgi:hypothetical protein